MDITAQYAQQLVREKMQKNTIKNYVSDVRQFLAWKYMTAPNVHIDSQLIDQYLRVISFARSSQTIHRKYVSLSKFLQWVSLPHNNESDIAEKPKENIPYKFTFATIGALIILLLPLSISTSTVNEYSEEVFAPTETSLSQENISINNKPIDLSVEGVEVAVSGYEIESPMSDPAEMLLTLQENIDAQQEDIESLSPNGGRHIIEANSTYTIILDESINPHSIITVTPTSETQGQQLYVNSQGDGFAVIAIEEEIDTDLPFNWISIE